MKIVQINDNLKINIEMIYSLEKYDNQFNINEWENNYKEYLEQFTKEPPLLEIDGGELYQPNVNEVIDTDKCKAYAEALNEYIINTIGEKPDYYEEFCIILCTGLKVNIDKTIYDKVNEYLERYINKEN